MEKPPLSERPHASLPPEEKARLATEESAFVATRPIDIPGFPSGTTRAVWRVIFNNKAPVDVHVELYAEPNKNPVAEIEVAPREYKKRPTWRYIHRYVNEELRGKQLGTYVHATGESFLRDLNEARPASATNVIEMHNSMPSVTELGLSLGYHMLEEDRPLWEKFQAEFKNPANKEAFERNGELPSFQMADIQLELEDGSYDKLVRDQIVLIKEQIPPDADLARLGMWLGRTNIKTSKWDEGFGPLSRLPVLRKKYGGPRLPFVMNIRLEKELS